MQDNSCYSNDVKQRRELITEQFVKNETE